jgi:hypothetical protein
VTVAGRDHAQAAAVAAELGPRHTAAAVDLTSAAECRAALGGHAVAVCCAGPFSTLGSTLLDACLAERRHYVDIADDRRYVAEVRARDAQFRAVGRVAAYGCSSLPALSGALALAARGEAEPEPPQAARVTLFIGNRNRKGRGAIGSAVAGLGMPVRAPQATLHGFREGESVALPQPFGRRRVYTFESPDYDLLPALVGVAAVRVKVGFELRLATRFFALLAALGSGYGPRTAAALELLGRLAPALGCSGGVVQSELFWAGGRSRRASLSSPQHGQRLAILPGALVAAALDRGLAVVGGAQTAYEVLGAAPLLQGVADCGFELAVV